MDIDDIGELLFDISPSQDLPADGYTDETDDEILETEYDDEEILWGFEHGPALTARTADNSSTEERKEGASGTAQHDLGRTAISVRDRHWVIGRIEEMLESVLDGLLDDARPVSVTLKSRSGFSRRGANGAVPAPRTQEISFPGSKGQEAWRFTVLVRILELVHACLVDDTVMTKRDLYYRHPDLFVKQSVVDRYIDDLACTLEVPRSLLNVTAAAKGVVAGSFAVKRRDGTVTNGLSDKEGKLVPKVHDCDTLELSAVQWILVIEKEATFRSLLSSSQWTLLASRGVVLTAKGYPDLASREFLRRLADLAPNVPMYALVDFDPDGIAIMSTYKHGSYRLAHEEVTHKDTPGLKLPELRWLGVRSHQISPSPVVDGGCTETAATADPQGLMRLTARDRKKAHRMLEWDLCAEGGPEPEWRAELQRMLMLNVKAEMQILDERPGGLVAWLSSKLDAWHGSGWPAGTGSDDELLF